MKKIPIIVTRLLQHLLSGIPVLRGPVDEAVVHRPLVGARHALALEVVIGHGPLVSVLQRRRVEVESVVNVDLGALGNVPDDPDDLLVLEAEAHCVGVAAVVEEGHGGEDGSTDWNDVKLNDVVIKENEKHSKH